MSLSGLDSGHPLVFSIIFRAAAIQTRETEFFQKTNLSLCFQAWRQTLAANVSSNEKKSRSEFTLFFSPFRVSKMLIGAVTPELQPQ